MSENKKDTVTVFDEMENEATATFTVIPEFPSWTILPLLLMATLTAVIIKQRLTKAPNRQKNSLILGN